MRSARGAVRWYDQVQDLAALLRQELMEETRWQTLTGLFREIDSDGSGFIETREFARMLVALEMRIPMEGIIELMEAMDSNGDGRIDYREFMEFMVEGPAEPVMGSARKAAPSSARKSARGGLSRTPWYMQDELRELAQMVRMELLQEARFQAVGEMFDQLDTDGSGFIETREMANM